jgi:hypothetical protein
MRATLRADAHVAAGRVWPPRPEPGWVGRAAATRRSATTSRGCSLTWRARARTAGYITSDGADRAIP